MHVPMLPNCVQTHEAVSECSNLCLVKSNQSARQTQLSLMADTMEEGLLMDMLRLDIRKTKLLKVQTGPHVTHAIPQLLHVHQI